MGMNINELRERIAKLNSKTSKGGDTWKPKDEHLVRLIQHPGMADPFTEVYFHNDIGESFPIRCPKMNDDEDCIICEFADQLRAWKDSDGKDKPEADRKADFEIFKKIQAKARVYTGVVEMSPETGEPLNETAKWWSMTTNQAQQALELALDGDRLAELGIDKDDGVGALKVIFDPKKAYNIAVSYAKPGEKGNTKTFTIVTLKGKIKPTPLSKNQETIDKVIKSLKPLKEIITVETPESVERAFKKFMNADSKEASSDASKDKEKYPKEAAKSEKAAPNTKESAKLSGTRSLSEAFDEIAGD